MKYKITFFEVPNNIGSDSVADIDRKRRGKYLWSHTESVIPRVGEFFNQVVHIGGLRWEQTMFKVEGVVYQVYRHDNGGDYTSEEDDQISLNVHVYLNRV